MREYIEKMLIFLSFLFGWEWKNEKREKMGLNKFTHISLLKNNAQLKKKVQLPEIIKK